MLSSEPYEISNEDNAEIKSVSPKVAYKKCPNTFKGILFILNLFISRGYILICIFLLRHEI